MDQLYKKVQDSKNLCLAGPPIEVFADSRLTTIFTELVLCDYLIGILPSQQTKICRPSLDNLYSSPSMSPHQPIIPDDYLYTVKQIWW